ncbi:MAG: 2-oxoacid:ferredoxin oxidoreductase subunit beta [Candidatus Marinimicrobia bacterium]|nr:2-oxoacid:ferredoxin oxidoreductase subunit beta [Candidatus Neomarinimicrobiota bacterium]
MAEAAAEPQALTRKDFTSDQTVRWCPGCGDYSILAQTQKTFPELGRKREEFVFVSGIGCSSRFPYYMNTYGFHTIHGRATAVATGLKLANPDLSVWVVTGDGDGLSIGGNHLIHLLRRNLDINLMLFNNRIYGLTKGQYSPTSETGKITKSTPMGSLDWPFNPPVLALGAAATFVARSADVESKHMQQMIKASYAHHGTSFLEIYQNCLIFNDDAFKDITEKSTKEDHQLLLENGQPMLFGRGRTKGIGLDGHRPVVLDLEGGKHSVDEVLVHDESDRIIALILSEMTYKTEFPVPLGVIYQVEKSTYEDLVHQQIEKAIEKFGPGDLETIINGGHTWEVN